jgi:hypothetical protein
MNATMTTATNGKPRKQLSDQLDRLDVQMDRADAILDALSEGLNGAVADATKEGTRAAVKDAVIELLTDPELRAALHKASAPPTGPRVSVWDRLRAKARQLAARTAAMARSVRQAVAAKVAEAKAIVAGAAAPAWVAWQFRKAAVVGLGIGVVVTGVAYLGGHGLAAGLSGLGAAVTTVAVQAALWVRKTVRLLVPS